MDHLKIEKEPKKSEYVLTDEDKRRVKEIEDELEMITSLQEEFSNKVKKLNGYLNEVENSLKSVVEGGLGSEISKSVIRRLDQEVVDSAVDWLDKISFVMDNTEAIKINGNALGITRLIEESKKLMPINGGYSEILEGLRNATEEKR